METTEQHRPSRLVVVESVYCQQEGEQPDSLDAGYARWLTTDQQPLVRRRLTIGPEWQPLDCQWLDKAGLLVLENVEGRNLARQPSADELAAIRGRVIELAYAGTPLDRSWLIPPGESFRGCPANLDGLRIRCRCGQAKALLSLFPV